jgi:ABC-type sugar transport system permease subunit
MVLDPQPPVTTAYNVFMGDEVRGRFPLGGGAWAFLSVTLFNIWQGSSFVGVFLLAGINAVPPSCSSALLGRGGVALLAGHRAPVSLPGPARFLSLTWGFADLANVWMLTAGHRLPVIGTQAYWLAIRAVSSERPRRSPSPGPGSPRRALVLFRLFDPPPEEAHEPLMVAAAGTAPSSCWRSTVFPIYFMLVQSLKTPKEDVFGNPLIVMNPTLENFEELFERKSEVRGFVGDALRRSYPFLDWLGNTLIVFAGSVAATLGASVAAAYALGRLRPPGFRWWRRVIFATYVIPQTILFIPLFQVVNALGLDDNLLALLIIYPSMALPFCIWILSAYFQHLPGRSRNRPCRGGQPRTASSASSCP